MRIGLLGGSFDPPHICHLLAGQYLVETGAAERIWWLPVFDHAFGKGLAPWDHRLAMCRAVAAGTPWLDIDTAEWDRGGRSYTVETVAWLQSRHPEHAFRWIVGSDLLPQLPSWHRWDELRQRIGFVAIGRGDAIGPDDLPRGARVEVRDFALPDISSTLVRARRARGDAITELVPHAVAAYLDAHPELYR